AIANNDITWQDVLAARDVQGSKEKQAEVAAAKLDALRKKAAETTPPVTQQTAPVETTPAPEKPPVEQSNISASGNPLLVFKEALGDKFHSILGEMGYESESDVPASMMSAAISRMKDASTTRKNLNLGGK